jgi:hypothetical protein
MGSVVVLGLDYRKPSFLCRSAKKCIRARAGDRSSIQDSDVGQGQILYWTF